MPAPTFSRRFDSKPTLPNYTFPKAVVNRIPFFLTNYPTPVTRRFCDGNIRSSRRLKPGSKRVRSKARDLTRLLTSSTTAPRNTVHREKLKASNPEVSTTSPRSRPMRGKRGKRRQEEYPPLLSALADLKTCPAFLDAVRRRVYNFWKRTGDVVRERWRTRARNDSDGGGLIVK